MGKNWNKGKEENESVVDLRSAFQELLKTRANKIGKNWNKGRDEMKVAPFATRKSIIRSQFERN